VQAIDGGFKMEMERLFEKGNINEYAGSLKARFKPEEIRQFFTVICERIKDIKTGSCLELSHEYSNFFDVMSESFKESVFLCDDGFESLLAFNNSIQKKITLNVMNYFFNPKSFPRLNMNERFDIVVSLLGLSYDNLNMNLQELIGLLKVDGVMAVVIPSYWYDRAVLNESEEKILKYSKQNDKKWIFTEDIKPKITECGAALVDIIKLPFNAKLNRLELAYISSLTKLYDSIIKNNVAHLEITNIPEDNLEINVSLMLLQKSKKTITKDNLFNV
jgi:hypothetical protein